MLCDFDYTKMPQCVDIDFTNVDEVCAYQLLLCKIYECEGGFDIPAKCTLATRVVRRQCIGWLREVKILIESILSGGVTYANLGDIPRLLQSYDYFYRIGNGITCYDFLREVKLRTADLWAKGDRSVSQTDVVLLLLSEVDRNVGGLEERYAKYAIDEMSSWVDELVEYGVFEGVSMQETYRRLSYLLNADLFAYFGRKDEAKVKAQWVSYYTLTEEQIDALDADTLWAYADFVESIPFSSQKELKRNNLMYTHILSILASRPDVHPYLVKAIELTFKRREVLIA